MPFARFLVFAAFALSLSHHALASSQTRLIISEYIHSTSQGIEAVELCNTSSEPLPLDDYELRLYPDGATAFTASAVLGSSGSTLAPGEVLLIANVATVGSSSADLVLPALMDFDGNDTLSLFSFSFYYEVDVFGQIGTSPAAGFWGSGVTVSQNATLKRLDTVCQGNGYGFSDPADLTDEWVGHPDGEFSFFGTHEATCVDPLQLQVDSVTVLATDLSNATCIQLPVYLYNPNLIGITLHDLDIGLSLSGNTSYIDGDVFTGMMVANSFLGTSVNTTGIQNPPVDLVDENGAPTPSCGAIINPATLGEEGMDFFPGTGTANASWTYNNNAGGFGAKQWTLASMGEIGTIPPQEKILVGVLEIPILASPGYGQIDINPYYNKRIAVNTYRTWEDSAPGPEISMNISFAHAQIAIFPPIDWSAQTLTDLQGGDSGQDIQVAYLDPFAGGQGGQLRFHFETPPEIGDISITSNNGFYTYLYPDVSGVTTLDVSTSNDNTPNVGTQTTEYYVTFSLGYKNRSRFEQSRQTESHNLVLRATWMLPHCQLTFEEVTSPLQGYSLRAEIDNGWLPGKPYTFAMLTSNASNWMNDIPLTETGFTLNGTTLVYDHIVSLTPPMPGDEGTYTLSFNGVGEPAPVTCSVDFQLSGEAVFELSSYSVRENEGQLVGNLLRQNGSSGTLTVDLATMPGTASAGLDYVAVLETFTFADGETGPKPFSIDILDDRLLEGSETFTLDLQDSVATGGIPILRQSASSVTVTIEDVEEGALTWQAATAEANENDPTLTVLLERAGGQDGSVDVTVKTLSQTAQSGMDFVGILTSVTFPDNDATPIPVTIQLLDDNLVEPPETFILRLESPTGNAILGNIPDLTITLLDHEPGEISMSTAQTSIGENQGSVLVEIQRLNGTTGAVSAVLDTSDGTATSGLDYTGVHEVISFADGDDVPKTVSIPLLDDRLNESDETFIVALDTPTGGAIIGNHPQQEVTIEDIEEGTLQWDTSLLHVSEADGLALLEVQRLDGHDGNVSVEVSTASGTAIEGEDFLGVHQTLYFPSGRITGQTIEIPIVQDHQIESMESFTIHLSNPAGNALLGTIVTSTIEIEDFSPGQLSLSDASLSVLESVASLSFSVTRIDGTDGDLIGSVATAISGSGPGFASSGLDFQPLDQPVVFGDGDSTPQVFTLTILEDSLVEGTESFLVQLFDENQGGTRRVQSQANIQILDNDSQFTFTQSTKLVGEESGSFSAQVMRQGTYGTQDLRLSSLPGTAEAGTDFVNVNQILTWNDGQQGSKTALIQILDDTVTESNETFQLLLEPLGPNGVVGSPSTMTITIVDNDDNSDQLQFSWSTSPLMVTEDEETIQLTVTADPVPSQTVTLMLRFSGTATPHQDYHCATTSLEFSPDRQRNTFNLSALPDELYEGDETIILSLIFASGRFPTHTVTLKDNDPLPTATWTTAHQSIREGGEHQTAVIGTVTAELSALSEAAVRIPFTVSGTATYGSDHNLPSGAMQFAPGQRQATLRFLILNDEVAENLENLILTLQPEGLNSQPSIHRIDLLDDDLDGAPETTITLPADGDVFLAGEAITFQAFGDHASNQPLQLFWEICRTSGECLNLEGTTFNRVIETPGIYRAFCLAATAEGASDPTPDMVVFTVVERPPLTARILSPEANYLEVTPGTSVQFLAQDTGPVSSRQWFFQHDQTALGDSRALTHSFDMAPGLYTLVYGVADENGQTAGDFRVIRILEPQASPLRIRITEPENNSVFEVGDSLTFAAEQVALKQAKGWNYRWYLGDGRQSDGQRVTGISFTQPGRYRVRCFALSDTTGARIENQVTVFIRNTSAVPLVDIGFPDQLHLEPALGKRNVGVREFFLRPIVKNAQGFEQLNYFWDFGDGRTSRRALPGPLLYEQPGTYTLRLLATTPSGVQSSVVTRTITVSQTNDQDFEPNEHFQEARVLHPGNYVGLALDEQSIVDYFAVDLDHDAQTLTLSFQTPQQALVELYNHEETLLNRQLVSGTRSFRLESLSAGRYYVVVHPAPGQKTPGLGYGMGVSVENPALFFPGISDHTTSQSVIGFVNASETVASVQLMGFDQSGNLLSMIPSQLNAQGQFLESIDALFGPLAPQVAWVEVDSSVNLDGFSLKQSRDEQELTAVNAPKKLADRLYMPHIAEDVALWYTDIHAINGFHGGINARMEAFETSQPLGLQDAYQKDRFNPVERYDPNTLSDQAWGLLMEEAGQPGLAAVEYFGTKDGSRLGAGLNVIDPQQDNPSFVYIRNDLYFTHIAQDTATFWTGLAIVNTSNEAQEILMTGYDSDGNSINQTSLSLSPNEKRVSLAETFLAGIGTPEEVAWVKLESDRHIAGFELFGTWDGERLAGMEAPSALSTDLKFPYIDPNPEVVTGLVLLNPLAEANSVSLTLFDTAGGILAEKEVQLNPFQKLSTTVSDLFGPQTNRLDIASYVRARGNRAMTGFTLLVDTKNRQRMAAVLAQ
jgi:PKD repeat protein